MPGDVSISVVAICKNEEADLPGFLANLAPWVDEIVLVDDESSDSTLAIAEAAGEKVIVVSQLMSKEGFAGQRNAGIAASSGDWILNMDIDERVTPTLRDEILAAISNTCLNGYRYRRLNFFLHRPMKAGGWTTWNNPQLARKNYHRYVNKLHERCVVEGAPEAVGQLSGFMWHLNDDSYEERMNKSFQYCKLVAEELIGDGRKISWASLLLRPLKIFLKKYVLQRGFLDKTPGLIAALHSADAEFRACALVWDAQNRISRAYLEEQVKAEGSN